MRKISLVFLAFLLVSCHSAVKKEDIKKLNGYWEIKEVTLSDGKTKDYKVNETIDFFELKGTNGFRQKVMPQFDGKFKTNNIVEAINIIQTDDTFFIEYNTAYGKWKEEILTIEDSTLVLKNKDNLEYTYKRFKPFSFN